MADEDDDDVYIDEEEEECDDCDDNFSLSDLFPQAKHSHRVKPIGEPIRVGVGSVLKF